MTGITKEELMQMARESGLEFCEEESAHSVYVSLAQFTSAILERAAVECDTAKERYKGMAEEEDKTSLEDSKYWNYISPLAGAAYDIRALKINTGD